MSRFTPAVAVMGALTLGGGAAQAGVIGVSDLLGSVGGSGGSATIILAPTDVSDDAPGASNTAMQAFDEKQGVVLTSAIDTDTGSIPAGRFVDSHMIFLNSPNNEFISHSFVEWTFANKILGVMSDVDGAKMAASDGQLGVPTTTYPGVFANRGFEGPGEGSFLDDYTVSGNTITVSMGVNDPGDWIRVVTAAVPVPAAFPLLGGALALLGAVGLRRRNKS